MTNEKTCEAVSGWRMLAITVLAYALFVWLFIEGIIAVQGRGAPKPWLWIPVPLIAAILMTLGFFVLWPNEAAALVLFGDYKGTVKKNGFWWRNPFMSVKKISLRARNLNGDKLKVNDKSGNPIDIAAVVVWRVENTAQALFDVDDYSDYVSTQSEAAVRNLAGRYHYDSTDPNELTLRGGTEDVNHDLQRELQERLGHAGVQVIEARISHLAYASEIAGAMLRRQQARAVVQARQQIVEGAVGMVEMALTLLGEKKIVDLDNERKAAMVSNLMVVLCGEESAKPIVNTGTLYP
ncbi:MAG TPA: SPFH domain-containing protein [bacterium]|nr:SPFH domain-containing protein [bacterium]HQL60866.1 SPFH domain-containing protein [bacterium]